MKNQDFILTNNVESLDLELIEVVFCSLDEKLNLDNFTIMPLESTLPELMVVSGAFSSKGLAKSNGFNNEIPLGFTKSGTKKKPIWIWKE